MKESPQKYFRALGFVFFFEGFNSSLLYSIGPLLLANPSFQNYNHIKEIDQENIEDVNGDPAINEVKGYIALYFAFYLLAYYLFQFIGMFFWSNKISTVNIKYCIVAMIAVSSICILLISMKISIPIIIAMRCIQGFFSSPVGLAKLTIDKKFSPRRDMQRIVDIVTYWFFGIVLGTSTTGILSNPQRKFSPELAKMPILQSYPFILPSVANLIFACVLIIIVLAMFPYFKENKKQYKKMQSTMFFQSVFFMSQNDFTEVITRHQRTRQTFNKNTIKTIIWRDRNLLFAMIHSGIAYFVFYGFLELFTLYCVTVLDIKNELFISIVHSVAIFGAFLYEIFFIDVNFFERNEIPRKTNKDLAMTWVLAITALSCLYFLRTFLLINIYFFLAMVCLSHMIFCISFCHILSFNNYLIEQTSLQCGDDADHARNLAQFGASLAKVIGPFTFSLFVAFNFWQIQDLYLDFLYAFSFALILILVAYMILSCLDVNWKKPETEQSYTQKLLESTSSQHDVFA